MEFFRSSDLAGHLPIFVLASCLKLLLVPAYFSTDFDVHRNWLAITHRLPPSQWYWDSTSIWTLDYPPFFAYFEWALAKLAVAVFGLVGKPEVADELLQLTSGVAHSPSAVLFQRLSVIVFSDGALFLGVCALQAALDQRQKQAGKQTASIKTSTGLRALQWLLLLHPGLTLVDNLHFQYNGLLFGLMLAAVAMAYAGRPVGCGLLFVALVLTKHLFLVLGPVVAAYLVAVLLSSPRAQATKQLLALVTGSVGLLALALGPVLLPATWEKTSLSVVSSNFKQLLSRLFPFEARGLVHAYWAPNLWALYMAADKVAASASAVACKRYPGLLPKLGLCGLRAASPALSSASSATVVAAVPNAVNSSSYLQYLPQPTPSICAALVMLFILPVAVVTYVRVRRALRNNRSTTGGGTSHAAAAGDALLTGCVLSYACSFLFGWHVHEKASLYFVVPLLVLLAVRRHHHGQTQTQAAADTSAAWVLHLSCCLSLFPLIFTSLEQPFIITHAAAYSIGLYWWLGSGLSLSSHGSARLLRFASYSGLAVALVFLESCYADALPICRRLPFAPLMLVSVVCAVGFILGAGQLYWGTLSLGIGTGRTKKQA